MHSVRPAHSVRPPHSAVRKAIYEGDRQLRRGAARFGEEVRALRIHAGLSQSQLAAAIGVARSVVCELEAGDPSVTLRTRFRVAALLGADMRLGLYASASPLISDPVQAQIVEAIVAACHDRWHTTVEAPVPGPGRRSSDLRLEDGWDIVLAEVETKIRSWEGILRELHDKRDTVAAAYPDALLHVLLVLPHTRHHRQLVRAHPATVAASFPAAPSDVLSALRDGGPWPGDALLWVRSDGSLVG
ncbi:MAG: helix-turn-helix domain-containing protein [Chloroflexi bacterium]|nr:helix-turn-helix domain-containing protein [Chloroflexota bacterium]